MYKEQVLSYKHLDEPLDEGRFVFECILAGNLQAFTTCRPQLFHVHNTLDCILHLFGLTLFLEFCSLLQNKLFIPCNSTSIELFHSRYWAKLDQTKIN